MKKFLLLSFLFFLSQTMLPQEYQNWKWVHPKPQGNNLAWVKMFNNNCWYMVGSDGTFLKTTDAGNSWFYHHHAGIITTFGTHSNLLDAYFKNLDTGYVVGQGGIFTTVNGGVTFEPLTNPFPTTSNAYTAKMVNDKAGYSAGTFGIAKTTDGGFSWNVFTSLPAGTYQDVASPNDTLILAITTTTMQRSTNGGLTFSTIATGTSPMQKIVFKNTSTAYLVSLGSQKVKMTTDGGLTWTNISANIGTTWPANDFDIIGDDVYLTISFYLYKTSDNGLTWTRITLPYQTTPWTFNIGFNSTSFYNDRFITVGHYGAIGLKIGNDTPFILNEIKSVSSISDLWTYDGVTKIIGTISGQNLANPFDRVIYSTDGGTTWALSVFNNLSKSTNDSLPTLYKPYFYGIDMVTLDLGYIVGNIGVFKTTNGGMNWDSLAYGFNEDTLNSIDFISPTTGWVFGNSGKVYKTTNAGINWVIQPTGTFNHINKGSMVDSLNGWFAGANGSVYKTTNGGAAWVQVNAGVGVAALYKIVAVTPNIVYVCGASSKAAKTIDGGNSWTQLSLPGLSNNNFRAMDFADEWHGVIGGAYGGVMFTTDGGMNWTLENTGGWTVQSVAMAKILSSDNRIAFTGGSGGTIHKHTLLPLPVEMKTFSAKVNGSSVQLCWSTATELNNKGFAVERKQNGSEYKQIAFINGKGTTTVPQSYSYSDQVTSGVYLYKLKQVDLDGTFTYSYEVKAVISVPEIFELAQNYPNPFNPSTKISWQSPLSSWQTLKVYNVLGTEVATLVNEEKEAGHHSIDFNASELPSGVYFYRIQSSPSTSSGQVFIDTKKMLLLK